MSLSPHLLDATVERLARPISGPILRRVHGAFVARSLAELLHERLLDASASPQSDGTFVLRLVADDPRITWSFRAIRRRLDFWHIDASTVERRVGAQITPSCDAATLFLDFRRRIGIEPFTLARFVEETAQTLYADACISARGRPAAWELARADHQTIEGSMEGHPWILVNKGRVGFGAVEQQELAPEAALPQRIVWLAAHKDAATAYTVDGLDYETFLRGELGGELDALHARLVARGLEPHDYVLLPAHAWQFANKLIAQFAHEVSEERLVPLGASAALYRPQQSIRTFQNASAPERCFVKTALSILNTGQIRGLSAKKLRRAPRVTEWLRHRLHDDAVLRAAGTVFLGEVATVAYEHPIFERIDGAPYQYTELLGVLFRESAVLHLRAGESLASMASLLYVDDHGHALVAALAERAGVTLDVWLVHYLRAYLVPLLHCFFHHETYFVAHGENTLLVLRDGLPVRVVLKDLVEEIQVSRRVRAALPADLQDLFYNIDDALVPLFLLTDVVDGFFRYLADVLASRCGVAEDTFWRLVARTIRDYQGEHPELAGAFSRHDLFVAEFPRFCLNKYRLVLFGYSETAHNTLDTAPQFDGTLPNPLAASWQGAS